jgi:hypothetical protein
VENFPPPYSQLACEAMARRQSDGTKPWRLLGGGRRGQYDLAPVPSAVDLTSDAADNVPEESAVPIPLKANAATHNWEVRKRRWRPSRCPLPLPSLFSSLSLSTFHE